MKITITLKKATFSKKELNIIGCVVELLKNLFGEKSVEWIIK